MASRSVRIATQDGVADAFVSLPDGNARFPAVLFYMDAFGLRPGLRAMAERIAAGGFYVLQPNVFYRAGPAPLFELPDLRTRTGLESVYGTVRPLVDAHSSDEAIRDAGAYLDFLAEQPEVAPGGVGVVGYCMGGRLAVRAATGHPGRVVVAASFHAGDLASDRADSPHRLLGDVAAELYFGHAESDLSMPPDQVARLAAALDAAATTYTCEVYPGTVHGFAMADTATYHRPAADRHWSALMDLLRGTLAPS